MKIAGITPFLPARSLPKPSFPVADGGFSQKSASQAFPMLPVGVRFGATAAAAKTPPLTPDQVGLSQDVADTIKLMMKIPIPRAEETWPLAIMSLLLREDSVEKYLEQNCKVTRSAISYGIDSVCLPKMKHLSEQKLDAKYYESEIRPKLKAFAAAEGEDTITPVDVWRWLMKTDPNGKLNDLLKGCGLDEASVNRLKEAPPLKSLVVEEKSQRQSKEAINAFRRTIEELPKRVIGQDDPLKELVNGMRVAGNGYVTNKKKPNRPKVRFLLLGPSGVGKTYSAELLAELFGRPVIYVTFTEYMDEMDAKKLTGSAPGYVGYGEPSFVDKVRKARDEAAKNGTPLPMIIFDEIEKGHPDVIRTLLQILDKGEIEDAKQQKAIFKGIDILMTSNVAQKEIAELQAVHLEEVQLAEKAGKTKPELEDLLKRQKQDMENLVKEALKDAFPREFIGRINKKIVYKSLTRESAGEILDLQSKEMAKAVKEEDGYELTIDKSLRERMIDAGYSMDTGSRQIEDALQTYLHEPLLEQVEDMVLADKSLEGGKMTASWDAKAERTVFKYTAPKPSKLPLDKVTLAPVNPTQPSGKKPVVREEAPLGTAALTTPLDNKEDKSPKQ